MPELESAQWSDEGDAQWLCIASAEYSTAFLEEPDSRLLSPRTCSNAPLHRCLLRVLALVVKPLDAAHSVEKMDISFGGEVLNFDQAA